MNDGEWRRLVGTLLAYRVDTDRAVEAALEISEEADRSRLPELRRLFLSGDYFLRECLGDPIARLDGPAALPLLLDGLDTGVREGHDHDGLAAAITDVVTADPAATAPALLNLLGSAKTRDRANAVWLLGYAAGAIGPESLIRALNDPAPEVRANAAGALSAFAGHAGVLDALLTLANDPVEPVRAAVASALGYLGDRRAEADLVLMLSDESPPVRRSAGDALTRLRSPSIP